MAPAVPCAVPSARMIGLLRWTWAMSARRGHNVAAVALANKLARSRLGHDGPRSGLSAELAGRPDSSSGEPCSAASPYTEPHARLRRSRKNDAPQVGPASDQSVPRSGLSRPNGYLASDARNASGPERRTAQLKGRIDTRNLPPRQPVNLFLANRVESIDTRGASHTARPFRCLDFHVLLPCLYDR